MIHISNVLGNVFTFIRGDGRQFTIAVDMLATAAYGVVPPIPVNISREQGEVFAVENAVEPHRLARIGLRELAEPIMLLDMEDGTHTLVDGSHRYVVAARMGLKVLPGWIIAKQDWMPYRVSGMPKLRRDHLQTMYSGID
jgi:hypothetical protein